MSRASANRRRALAAQADAALLAWCREIEEIERGTWLTDEECLAACDHQADLIRMVTAAQAVTAAGLAAKLKVLRVLDPICDDTAFEQSAKKVFLSALADADRFAGEATVAQRPL